jgi:FixJ family two-component response regulator
MKNAQPLIAVLDDEPPMRKALLRLLHSAGFDVEVSSSGADLLEAMHSYAPDCLVLDLHMPGLSGFDVMARLAQAGVHLPVVVITGYDTPETRAQALGMGASAYLPKPVDEGALLAAISAAIGDGNTPPLPSHPGPVR